MGYRSLGAALGDCAATTAQVRAARSNSGRDEEPVAQAGSGQVLATASLPIDDCEGVPNIGSFLEEVLSRQHDLATRADYILNDRHDSSVQVDALGDLLRRVGLSLQPDVHSRDARLERQGRSERNAAKLQAGKHLDVGRGWPSAASTSPPSTPSPSPMKWSVPPTWW